MNNGGKSQFGDEVQSRLPNVDSLEVEALKQEIMELKACLDAEHVKASNEARLAAEAKSLAVQEAENAKAEAKAEDEQLKLRYEHAKLANTHADGMIQSAERKGSFLLTLNSALFLFFANDLPSKLKTIYGLAANHQLGLMAFGAVIVALLIAFGLLVASYWALYSLFTPRIKENEFLSSWGSSYRPKELIFFDAICRLSKDEYHRRYDTLTLKECWDDLSFQAYKQAQIASIKYACFHRAKSTSVWAWSIAMVAALVTRFFV